MIDDAKPPWVRSEPASTSGEVCFIPLTPVSTFSVLRSLPFSVFGFRESWEERKKEEEGRTGD